MRIIRARSSYVAHPSYVHVDGGEPEQALAAAGFLSEVREIHHVYEREADAYGYAYIAKKGIAIDCLRLYHKIAGDEPVSTDKHDPIEERCRGR